MLLISAPMLNSIISVVVVLVIVAVFAIKPVLKRRRRKQALAEPFPDEWVTILDRNLPIFDKLSDNVQGQFRDLIRIFLAEKTFIGYHGVEITDEVRVTVAGQACLLLLNRETDVYPLLSTIVMYPTAFFSGDDKQARLGESWTRGSIILAWDHSKGDARNFHDGHNLVIHEFAHQLDDQTGEAVGTPLLADGDLLARWKGAFSEAHERHLGDLEGDRHVLFDQDAAESPAEFFATAAELFFTIPRELKKEFSGVYGVLREHFGLDPAGW